MEVKPAPYNVGGIPSFWLLDLPFQNDSFRSVPFRSVAAIASNSFFYYSRAQNSSSRNSIQLLQRACMTHTHTHWNTHRPGQGRMHTYIMMWPRKVCYRKRFLATGCQIAKAREEQLKSGRENRGELERTDRRNSKLRKKYICYKGIFLKDNRWLLRKFFKISNKLPF